MYFDEGGSEHSPNHKVIPSDNIADCLLVLTGFAVRIGGLIAFEISQYR